MPSASWKQWRAAGSGQAPLLLHPLTGTSCAGIVPDPPSRPVPSGAAGQGEEVGMAGKKEICFGP